MIAETSSSNGAGHSLAKKSLFNRPSWSRPKALIDGTDLFHRSNQKYVDHATEQVLQRKRKLARKERERARRNDGCEERAEKRQRVSAAEDDDDDDNSASDGGSQDSTSDKEQEQHDSDTKSTNEAPSIGKLQTQKHSPQSLLKRYERAVAAKHANRNPHVSDVVDLEDEEYIPEASNEGADLEILSTKLAKPPLKDHEIVSDEEFPELARQAREKACRAQLGEEVASATPDPLPDLKEDFYDESQNPHLLTPPPPISPPSDPILQIFITSSLPNSVPLIVNRKLSQRLKDVRLAWIERQRFPSNMVDKVFLTWRGKRLFDVTSCRSLGISSGANGRIMAKGNDIIDHEGRIHMEAMTIELLEANKHVKSNESAQGNDNENEEPILTGQEEEEEAQIKIICKAKGFPDFKLIVRPVGCLGNLKPDIANLQQSTMISKICRAFRSQNQLGSEKEVYLMFDGDKLSHHSKLADTELSDMDTIDVIVK
ncbi:hypothetical protein ACLMJK_005878 [Lecanora helva]